VTFRARTYAEDDARLASLVPGGGEDRVLKVRSFEIRGLFSTDGVSNSASASASSSARLPTRPRSAPAPSRSPVDRATCLSPATTDADKAALVQTYRPSRARPDFR
jgi:hypothetical protein